MQFLLAVSLLAATTTATLVAFPNGAVTPFDPSNPVGTTSQHGLAIPYTYGLHPYHAYGKREAQHLVTFPNGAVTPFDPTNPVGTTSQGGVGIGLAYPYVYHYGKREAQVPVSLVTGVAHTAVPYFGGFLGHAVAPVVSPFVAHPNGALVPQEPEDVVQARADHLAAVAEAGK